MSRQSIYPGLIILKGIDSPPPAKRARHSNSHETQLKTEPGLTFSEYGPEWEDWPAPRLAMQEAREFILDM